MNHEGRIGGTFSCMPAVVAAALLVAAGGGWGTSITASSLTEAAIDAVKSEFAGAGELEIAGGTVTVPDEIDGEDLEIRPVRVSSENRGPVHVTLDLFRDGKRVSRRVVTFEVRVYRDILVAAEPLKRHSELTDESVLFERRDVRSLAGGTISDVDAIEGTRTKRMIREGDPILAGAVEKIPVISRGEKVLLLVSVGGVRISATGTAMEDGAPGEAITVKNDRSGKRLRCNVVSAGVVRVRLAGAAVNGG